MSEAEFSPIEEPTAEPTAEPAPEELMVSTAAELTLAKAAYDKALAAHQKAARAVAVAGQVRFPLPEVNRLARKHDRQCAEARASALRMLE